MTPRKATPTDDDQQKIASSDVQEAPKKRAPVRRKKVTAAPSVDLAKEDSGEVSQETMTTPEEVSHPAHTTETPKSSNRSFMESVGRRKTAIARVRLWKGSVKPTITVNNKPWDTYFSTEMLQTIVSSPLKTVGQWGKIELTCIVRGGGTIGQAEAVRHGIARVLLQLNPVFRKALKKAGFLKRDPREKERKKYGLRGARRAPQWQKR